MLYSEKVMDHTTIAGLIIIFMTLPFEVYVFFPMILSVMAIQKFRRMRKYWFFIILIINLCFMAIEISKWMGNIAFPIVFSTDLRNDALLLCQTGIFSLLLSVTGAKIYTILETKINL